MATDCFDEKSVLAFLAGALPVADRAQAEAHLASCASCADIVTWAAADLAHASRAPGQEGQPFLGQQLADRDPMGISGAGRHMPTGTAGNYPGQGPGDAPRPEVPRPAGFVLDATSMPVGDMVADETFKLE